MNKSEFISQLKANLSRLPENEIENAILYYNEYFDEAKNSNGNIDEAYIAYELGSPSKVASQIMANYAISAIESSPKSPKTGLSTFWLVIIALFASPIALSMAILIASLGFTLIIISVSLIFLFSVISVALILSGIFIILSNLNLIFIDIAIFLIKAGTGSILIGIGIIFSFITVTITKKSFGIVAKLMSKFLLRRN